MSSAHWDNDSPEGQENNSISEDIHEITPEQLSTRNMTEALVNRFWENVDHKMSNLTMEDFRSCDLPLARIKKIMKLDENVKMISAEAPIMLSKAADLFIQELTLRAWYNTINGKRRTLQRSDICAAATQNEQFDFLIDILPREEGIVDDHPVTPEITNETECDEDSNTSETMQQNSFDSLSYQCWTQQQQQPCENQDLPQMGAVISNATPFYLVQVNDNGQIMLTNGQNIAMGDSTAQIIQLSQEQVDQLISMQSSDQLQYSPFLVMPTDASPQQHLQMHIGDGVADQQDLASEELHQIYHNNSSQL